MIWLWNWKQTNKVYEILQIAGIDAKNITSKEALYNVGSVAIRFCCPHSAGVVNVYAKRATAVDAEGLFIRKKKYI